MDNGTDIVRPIKVQAHGLIKQLEKRIELRGKPRGDGTVYSTNYDDPDSGLSAAKRKVVEEIRDSTRPDPQVSLVGTPAEGVISGNIVTLTELWKAAALHRKHLDPNFTDAFTVTIPETPNATALGSTSYACDDFWFLGYFYIKICQNPDCTNCSWYEAYCP